MSSRWTRNGPPAVSSTYTMAEERDRGAMLPSGATKSRAADSLAGRRNRDPERLDRAQTEGSVAVTVAVAVPAATGVTVTVLPEAAVEMTADAEEIAR